MLQAHHEQSFCWEWLHGSCMPVKWIWWRVVETMFKVQFKLSKEHTPKSPIDTDLFTGGQILTYEFRDMLEKGQVDFKVGAIDKFTKKSVILTDGSEIETDMVI